jgi:ABC-2 type transport system permease protein
MSRDIPVALRAEWLKIRRSLLPWVTLAAILLAALAGAFFMFVLQDVDRAKAMGLLGAKAQLSKGSADWPGYFGLSAQIAAVGGLGIFGIIMIWLFGREFTDRTAKDLLALPAARSAIVLAKFVVALVWCLVLTLLLVALTLTFGSILDLPGWSAANALHGAGIVLLTGALTVGLVTFYGLVASVARGYLPAVGAMFATLLSAQVVAAVGYGAWFAWSVPALLAGAAGPDQANPGLVGIASVPLVAVLSIAGTVAWWNRADHSL